MVQCIQGSELRVQQQTVTECIYNLERGTWNSELLEE